MKIRQKRFYWFSAVPEAITNDKECPVLSRVAVDPVLDLQKQDFSPFFLKVI
jgi:hypothetical protein